jgi:30S ribosomal protein 3
MQNITLQILWLDDALGLSVNQRNSHGTIPLTPYYFWPVTESWEQIRFELDSKPWIPEEKRIKLLNLVVDIMTKWQQSRTLTNSSTIKLPDRAIIIGLP